MKNNRYNTVFLIFLYLLFAFLSVSSLLLGSQVFGSISETVDDNYAVRTSLAYVSAKARQCAGSGSIYADEADGVKMLVLVEDDGLSVYETRIYHYDGALYEMYIGEGVPFHPSDGVRLVDVDGFGFSLKDGVVELTAKSANGAERSLVIALRA